MKKIFLFSTKFIYYWVLLPLIGIFALCLAFNNTVEHYLKLYPLIAVSLLGIVFTLVYFFRGVLISYEEIKAIGKFSSRDTAVINKGKSLILYKENRSRVKIILFGNDGIKPELSWMKSTQDAPKDISLFRAHTLGGNGTIKRVLKYFGADEGDFATILNEDCEIKYADVTVTSILENDVRKIYIKMDRTI